MDNNKRGDASIDDILEELKGRSAASGADGKGQNVDAILAEMGLGGGKKPSPFDNVRPGAPVPPPTPRAKTPPAAPVPQPPAPEPEPTPEPEPPAAEDVYYEEEYVEEAYIEEEPAPEEAPEPEKPRRSKSGTMIWDIELEHTDVGPRMGKAAALDKVDPDKYVGDSELNRWFDQDATMGTMAFSKKERKQAEKELRRRLAEEAKEEKDRRKSKGKTQAPLPEEEPEEAAIQYEETLYEEETIYEGTVPEETAPYEDAPYADEDYAPEKESTPAPGGFEPPKDFDFNEKPKRKGLFARLFSRKEEAPEDDAYDDARDDGYEDDYGGEETDAGDAFAAAFGDGNAPRERTPEPRPQPEPAYHSDEPPLADTAAFEAACAPPKPAPAADDGLLADTAAFAAAYAVPEEPDGDDALQADTTAFSAAYKRPQDDRQKTGSVSANTAAFEAAMQPPESDAAQPEDAYKHAFEAALSKGKQAPDTQPAPETGDPNTAEFAAALGKGPITRWPAEDKAKMDAKPDEAWGGDDHLASQSAFDQTSVWAKPKTNWDEEASFFDMGAATTTFDAQIAQRRTAAFDAIKIEDTQPGWKAKPLERDTRSFDLDKEDEVERVPTAAFTQEFDAGDGPVPEDRSLFLDDMVDDRFRQFFSETVIVDKAEEQQQDTKSRKRRKKTRSAILTGEFARMAEMAEQAELAELTGETLADEESFDDYDRPQDAPAIEKDIASLRTTLSRRTAATAIIALLLLWMGLSFSGTLPLPEAVSFAAKPMVFTIVYLVLVMAAIVINFTTVATGLAGLFSAPTVDSAPALAALGGVLQGAMLLVQVINKQPADATLFGGIVALVLCFNAFGKRVRAVSILRNFQLASAGMDHSAAYILDSSNELSYNITKGLEEEDPTLLISRPTALVKGFLRQSFSQRATDSTGRTLGWITLAAGLVATALTLFMGDWNIFGAVSAFAAVLCIAAPFSSSLVSGVPSLLLQRSTARIGAVVPGWSAIEELGNVNVVMATSKDIFPPHAVYLKGIKTFEKERIDEAILYASSVLIEGCDTLRDIFTGVIQGKSDMLYKVESLVQEPGRGFTAWVQNNRVVIGSREMLQKHDVTPPPMEIEVKYVPNGHMPVYLAVSGKLFAMFIIAYRADPEVRDTLNGLVKSGVSLLVHSDDMNVSGDLIEYAYKLPHGVVKVLGRRELEILGPLTTYTPESEGVMTHIGSFASFIGGMRYAAGCASSERMSSIVQLASVILAGVLCLLLAFGGSLANMSLGLALLYQAAWTLLVSIMPFMRRY